MAFDSAHPVFQTTDTFQQLINDLNHFGDNVDSDLSYIDSAVGNPSLLATAATALVPAINELNDSIGSGGLNTSAQTLIGAVNEIENVFDASAYEINSGGADFDIITGDDLTIQLGFSGDITLRRSGGRFAVLDEADSAFVLRNVVNVDAFSLRRDSATFYGVVNLPSVGDGSITSSEISATTVHGAIDEVNARIPNVYDRNGTLLNS